MPSASVHIDQRHIDIYIYRYISELGARREKAIYVMGPVAVTLESALAAAALTVDLPNLCSGVRARRRWCWVWCSVENRPVGERRQAGGCILQGGRPCLDFLHLGIVIFDRVDVGLPPKERKWKFKKRKCICICISYHAELMYLRVPQKPTLDTLTRQNAAISASDT